MAAMGNAVLSLSVRHQTCGFACLVDTTPQFKQRLPKDQMHIEPADVPSPPIAPTREERGDKSVMNLYKCNLNKCRKAVHIKTIGFALFSEVFPDCSASKKGPLGFPPDFHLKDSLAHVLNNTISRMEQDEEFLGFMVDLLNLHCRHESKTNGIDKHFKAIKKLKRKQDLAVLHPGVGSDHLQLINHTQTQTFEGVGGRKDPVHELKTKWSLKQAALIEADATQDQMWKQFKPCHKKEMHLLDLQGFITKKSSKSAESVVPPEQESVNLEVAHRLTGLATQSDALNEK